MVLKAREFLWRNVTEHQFQDWVKDIGLIYEWNGIHTRQSQGVLESLHKLKLHGWSEAYGIPDWYFWKEDVGHFWAELKAWSGRVDRRQRARIDSMRRAGETVYLWRPQDEEEIETIFREGRL